jgi:phosphoglycolate phosphatase
MDMTPNEDQKTPEGEVTQPEPTGEETEAPTGDAETPEAEGQAPEKPAADEESAGDAEPAEEAEATGDAEPAEEAAADAEPTDEAEPEPAEEAEPAAEPEAEAVESPAEEYAIRGLIFDLDGTLIDSANDLAASVNSVLEAMGRPTKSVEEVSSYIGDGVHKLLSRALDTDDDETIDEAMATFFDYYSEHYLDSTVPYPGAKDILEHFKDRQCAVVSNKPEIFCRAILNGLELDSNLVAIIGGDTTGVHKPDPKPFQEALDLMGIEPGQAVVIGDSLNDIEGGRAAGTLTCAVTFGLGDADVLTAANPDYTADNLQSLAQLFS